MRGRARRYFAIAAAAMLAAVSARADPGVGYCGPDVPQSAYGNINFWKPATTYSLLQTNGQRILLAEGGVGDNEAAALAGALSQAGNIDELWMSSPGGNMAQGLKMGRLIHSRGLAVRVPAGHACISSCTLAFLGGALRSVDAGAYYGIHMFTVYGSGGQAGMKGINDKVDFLTKKYGKQNIDEIYSVVLKQIEQQTAIGAAGLARYLVEMSASLDFLTGMTGQTNEGVCFVTRAGMQKYNVTNVE